MSEEPTNTKWYYIKEMWGGLGVFLIIVLWAILAFLNGDRRQTVELERIRACGQSENVAACIKAVR